MWEFLLKNISCCKVGGLNRGNVTIRRERLQEAETIVYRTDEVGAITIRIECAEQAVGTDEKVLNIKVQIYLKL